MSDTALTRTLRHVGFDEKEAAVYLALLEIGAGTATEVAKRAELKRSIVYHVIERLKKEGFAQDVPGMGIKRFSPAEPIKILQNASTALDDLKFMLPVMRALQSKGRNKPRIEFFEAKSAIEAVYRTYEKGRDVRYLTSMRRVGEHFPEEAKAWVRRFERGAIPAKAKHLLPDSKEDQRWGNKLASLGQHVRLLPKDISIDMDFAIVDDVLGITSFDPLFIVVIHSEKIARSASVLFDLAWKQGRAIK